MMTAVRRFAIAALALGLWGGSGRPAAAGDVGALVRDTKGQPVPDAVVVAAPESGTAATPVRPGRETVDQINREFVPYVKPIGVGSSVSFPNKDNIRHHVYSFSPPKVFELPLYVGTPANPVVFDRPGVVTIGCNIHDWMIAHIYVSESPHVGRTDSTGRVALSHLPPGRYTVRVWHPRLDVAETATRRSVTVPETGAVEVTWQVSLGADLRPRRAPMPGRGGYR
jgi:plastocyanin